MKDINRLGVKLVGGLQEVTTAWSGASLLVDLYRKLGLEQLANQILPAKKSAKGLTAGQTAESFILLNALGGECVEDMQHLRSDPGLAAILDYQPPAPETARQWLDRFHDENLLQDRPLQGSFIPAESSGLQGLREMNKRLVTSYITNLKPSRTVTLDIDTQFIETFKAEAKYCYEHYKAYQAMKVIWAETMLILNEEFRDGNVYAGKDIQRMIEESLQSLPTGEWKIKIRSDSAAYDLDMLDKWDQQHWEFAVSADIFATLRKEIEGLPEEDWKVWQVGKDGVVREWAEVAFSSNRKYERKDSRPYRYVAIRIRQPQGSFFHEGDTVRHYAIISNIWDLDGQALIEWQRGKAGTVEQVHHILVSELGGGVFPSYKHGVNAAWLRLQVLTYNLLELLKKAVLPKEYLKAQPKRLRFAVFTAVGKVISHSGQTLLRISDQILEALIRPGRKRIAILIPG
jgi:hypothetical protein